MPGTATSLPARVPPGPDNPLGDRALRLAAGKGTYLIHGTNNPIAVGLAVTHGCIRMYPEDIEALFELVPVGTRVRIVNEPVKVAWVEGELLLEAHPPVDAEGQSYEPDVEKFSELLREAVGESTVAIHWDYAREVLARADGVLATVGLEAEAPDALRKHRKLQRPRYPRRPRCPRCRPPPDGTFLRFLGRS